MFCCLFIFYINKCKNECSKCAEKTQVGSRLHKVCLWPDRHIVASRTFDNLCIFTASLARSAKLPEGLYILPMFFRYFFCMFSIHGAKTAINDALISAQKH